MLDKKVLRGVRVVVTSIIVAAFVAIALVTVVIPRAVDGASLTVLSGSMSPTIPAGAVVVVRPVDPADVVPGDVITFQRRPGAAFVTHRVVAVEDGEGLSFTTKGDANEREDLDAVPAAGVAGRVWFHVEYLGYLGEAVSSPLGLTIIAALVSLTLVWDRASSFIRHRVPRPAWLPSWTIDARPEAPHQQSDGSPAVPSSDGDSIQGAEVLDLIPVSGINVGLRSTTHIEQQLLLARLQVRASVRREALDILELVGGRVVALGSRDMIVSVSGTPEHLDGVEQLLRPLGTVEAQRSHVIHVGGDPASQTDATEPAESVAEPVNDLTTLVLRPPPPPGASSTSAPPNGRSRERAKR